MRVWGSNLDLSSGVIPLCHALPIQTEKQSVIIIYWQIKLIQLSRQLSLVYPEREREGKLPGVSGVNSPATARRPNQIVVLDFDSPRVFECYWSLRSARRGSSGAQLHRLSDLKWLGYCLCKFKLLWSTFKRRPRLWRRGVSIRKFGCFLGFRTWSAIALTLLSIRASVWAFSYRTLDHKCSQSMHCFSRL